MENRLRSYAVSVATLRSVGAGGFTPETLMVPLTFADTVVAETLAANKILIKENDKWAKQLEVALTELDRFKERYPNWKGF
jgi:hypothetical protein